MIDVALVSVIRRWHFREHISLRQIAKRTGLSRNTIRRFLRSNIVEPAHPQRTTPSKLDDFAAPFVEGLNAQTHAPRKQRKTLKHLHAELCAQGFTGSYDRVAAFARQWRQVQHEQAKSESRGTFVLLSFAAGEAFQFDWSEDFAVLAGEKTKLQVAQFKLSHSRAFFLIANARDAVRRTPACLQRVRRQSRSAASTTT